MSWDSVEIGELVEDGVADIQTGPFGTQLKASDYIEDGVPVINVRNIGYSDLRPEKIEFISDSKSEKLSVHKLDQSDIVFGRKGAVDRHLFVQESQMGWVQGSDCIRLRFDSPDINPRFISYSFLSTYHKQWMLNQCGNKATMASLNQDVVKRIKVKLPSKTHQDIIVDMLACYDDLIENNKRRIELLEESARQLYKEWFVRFRFPGHEHVKIIDGVPEGWTPTTLGAVATTNALSHKAKELPEEINYIDISSVSTGRILTKNHMASEDAPGRARRISRHGDVIWSNVRPNLRAYALVLHPDNLDVFSTGFTVLSGTEIPYSFLYNFTTTDNFVNHLVNHTTGASYPAVRPPDFERAELLLPPHLLLEQFHDICEPNFELCYMLAEQNVQLAAARDLLLPKLMNGGIAV